MLKVFVHTDIDISAIDVGSKSNYIGSKSFALKPKANDLELKAVCIESKAGAFNSRICAAGQNQREETLMQMLWLSSSV